MNNPAPCQLEGAYFLANNRFALLGDEQGIGKTAQAILACDAVNAKKILIICPAVARVNWKREFEEWSIFSPDFTICQTSKDYPTKRSIVSFDYASTNRGKLNEILWDVVIVDESQALKEPTAERTQAVYGKDGIIRNTKKLWALSGTPAPNHVGELWPMLYTFGTTPLSYEKFVERYCDTKPTFYGGVRENKIIGTKKTAFPEIKEMLSGVMLRRLKKDVLKELPPKSFFQVSVEGSPLSEILDMEASKAQRQGKKLKELLSGTDSADELAKIIEGLSDSMSTLRRYVGLQKVKACAELVRQELNDKAYEKIIIFAIHSEVIAGLMNALKEFAPVVLTGKTGLTARQMAIDDFQNKKDTRIFIGNIDAAGKAITLTAAHQVLFVEQDWVPGNNAQAADRAHRRGQLVPVTVRVASMADSIDEKVTKVLIKKTKELSQIFDSGNTQEN